MRNIIITIKKLAVLLTRVCAIVILQNFDSPIILIIDLEILLFHE